MGEKLDHFGKRVMNGEVNGLVGGTLRGLMGLAEPLYANAMRRRNRKFDTGRKQSVKLDRPTISIGNITSGGTGKTPVVRWLCEKLLKNNIKPAILMRGYRSKQTGGVGDEQMMLDQFFGGRGVSIEGNPDRVAGAAAVLARAPGIGAFILDDAFQHRRVKRDLDIVLISALEPFGYDHVLPRGLLREPLEGLSRATAVIITHAQRLSEESLENVKQRIRQHYPLGPIYLADHEPIGFRGPTTLPSGRIDHYDDALRGEPILAFCGLGNPRVFQEQLTSKGARIVAHRWFRDHHAYTAADLDQIYQQATASGAKFIITTEKDWTKVSKLPRPATGPDIWRLDVVIRFWGNDETAIMDQIRSVIGVPAKSV